MVHSKLSEFRKERELTQLEMADKIGVSLSYYTKIESSHKEPSFQFLKRLKKVYQDEISVDEVFFKKDPK